MRTHLLVALALGAGCYNPDLVDVTGHQVTKDEWTKSSRAIKDLAVSEMKCSEDKLTLSIISTSHPFMDVEAAEQVSVAGCGQQRMYTRAHDKWASGTSPTEP